ncbi:MAG: o-succinylbenzoate synthase [Acidobacteria bacterium]|jgi:O-succinylbenzoate synthase|nr:o-succinylbenzoate synthase [Acidobacteriota bacterium]
MIIKIKAVILNKYNIPFLSPLRVGKFTLNIREGLIVELTGADGIRGYGEIAPLEGFSIETLEQAEQQIYELTDILTGMDFEVNFNKPGCRFPTVEGLPHYLYPSTRFGLETAIINLVENNVKKSFPGIISQNPKMEIPVNALLHSDISRVDEDVKKLLADGFRTIKIKVGRGSLAGDIEMVNRVTALITADTRLRLDANRLWDFETALAFGMGIDTGCIEYIEEPFIIRDISQISEFSNQTGIGVALDESLNLISQGAGVHKRVAAFILKPTLLGGMKRTGEFVDLALSCGIKPVISSCFEVGPGFTMLTKMAASIKCDCASGLDTLKYLKENLLSKPVEIKNGFIYQ